MKPTKDIRQCPLYGGRYYADAEGHVYLDAEGNEEVGVYGTKGHLMTATAPLARVHRIIYYAFHPDTPDKGYDVHHINEIKTDNRLENLQLLTRGEHTALHKCIPVLQYSKEGVLIAEYPSAKDAERVTGISSGNISSVCSYRPQYNTAGGYIWRFKDDPLLPEQLSMHRGNYPRKPVLQYTKEGVFIAEYDSIREAEHVTHVSHEHISAVCRHYRQKSAGGFIWRFKDDPLLN